MAAPQRTFSEHWYRVKDLHLRLHPAAEVTRQVFRGVSWYVYSNPCKSEFYRIDEASYNFLGLLSVSRSVDEAWLDCMDKYGDGCPTQDEVLKLLSQMYNTGLLRGNLPPDSQVMFDNMQKESKKKIFAQAQNLLFLKIPLCNPDNFFSAVHGAGRFVFSRAFFVVWILLMFVAGWCVLGQTDRLFSESNKVISPDNLFLLYIALFFLKLFHEFGHGMACKHLGITEGTDGYVNSMGIMLFLFTPLPFIDTTSSWKFRNKWKRMFVGAAGIYVELFLGALAAILWSQTSSGATINSLCYNVMFVACVSTIIFNGNPLLRYDAYYVLADFLEIPNLYVRAGNWLKYAGKHYFLGVEHVDNPAHNVFEQRVFCVYSILSLIYRVMVMVGIVMFVASVLFIAGVIFGMTSLYSMFLKPAYSFYTYLKNSPELQSVRGQAVSRTLSVLAAGIIVVGLIPFPDNSYLDGVTENEDVVSVRLATSGTLLGYKAQDTVSIEEGTVLARLDNPELRTQLKVLYANMEEALSRRNSSQVENAAAAQIANERIESLSAKIESVEQELAETTIKAAKNGRWLPQSHDIYPGLFLSKGMELGKIVYGDKTVVRCVAAQEESARLLNESSGEVEIKIKGNADVTCKGRIIRIAKTGSKSIPSVALSNYAGGNIITTVSEENTPQSTEHLFEVQVEPEEGGRISTSGIYGQVVLVMVKHPPKSLFRQAIRMVQQVFLRKYNI